MGLATAGRRRYKSKSMSGFPSRFFTLAFLGHATISSMPAATPDLQAGLEALRQKHGVPALGAAVMVEGELRFLGVTGVRMVGSGTPVTTNDLWHLGSCTKSMTATLAGIMVDEGKVRWDMKITEVLPEYKTVLHPSWQDVTMEELLQHRSGAPAQANADAWSLAWQRRGSELAQRMMLIRSVVSRPTESPAGSTYLYSNLGYTIAGAMLERIAKKPYDQLLTEKVFTPLGMKSAGFGGCGENQPRGHTGSPGAFKAVEPDADNPPAITPAGRVHCSLGDYVRYASWHARGPLSDVKLMSDSTLQTLHTRGPGQTYAMGWGVARRDWADGDAINHNGTNTMWYAIMWVAPAKQLALVSVTNCPGPTGAKACDEAIGMMIQATAKR